MNDDIESEIAKVVNDIRSERILPADVSTCPQL